MGAQILHQASEKTGDTVGDRKSTSTVLAHAMLTEGIRNVVAGANGIDLKRGLDVGLKIVTDALLEQTNPVQSRTEKALVAMFSAQSISYLAFA